MDIAMPQTYDSWWYWKTMNNLPASSFFPAVFVVVFLDYFSYGILQCTMPLTNSSTGTDKWGHLVFYQANRLWLREDLKGADLIKHGG